LGVGWCARSSFTLRNGPERSEGAQGKLRKPKKVVGVAIFDHGALVRNPCEAELKFNLKSEIQKASYISNLSTRRHYLEKSIQYFNQAIRKGPSYALAYAGLANAYNMLGAYGHSIPREIYPKAHAAALKALALDDTLAEAHAALGFYNNVYEWDLVGSDRDLRRAIELNPGYAFAHIWRGELLSDMQRHAEAVAELDRARELDPTSLMVSDQRGWVLYMARRYDEAIAQIRRTVELEPRFAHAHCWLGKVYLQKGCCGRDWRT
jgi:tetratricopeptide (TPR) repeat protein